MRHKISVLLIIATVISAISLVLVPLLVYASTDAFNGNRLIDDAIYDNTNSMSASQIDSWLNQFPSSCISTNKGFSAPDPTGYTPTQGFTYGNNVSAGQIIHDAAATYGLNPQVILTTLQKEQSLVDGSAGCSTSRYAAAAGYGCPDGGTSYSYSGVDLYTINGTTVTSVSTTCVNTSLKVGFTQQVIRATWLLKFGEQRSEGNTNWNIQLSNYPQAGDHWDNSDDPQSCYGGPMTQGTWIRCPSGGSAYYDGYTTIDSTSVHMDNGATAALYWYTPHFAGNQSFDTIFTSWFGGLYATSYYAALFSQTDPAALNPGQNGPTAMLYKNLGTQPWYDDTSLASAPSGTYPVHLATDNPINRLSQFSATWPGAARPALNFSAVYESDGTTLAANQHVAQPGQIVKFAFTVTVPAGMASGRYREYFVPVLEGTSGTFNDNGAYITVTVNSVPALSTQNQSASPTIAPGTENNATLQLKNTGNAPLYDDTSISSAPASTYPVHLATSQPLNNLSDFSATWPGAARPALNFSAVYESDGTTLAANQHVAQPGQIVKFSFYISVPNQYAAGTYTLHVQPILEGTAGYFPDLGISWTITVPSTPTLLITDNSPNMSITSNEPGQISVAIQNIGNATANATTVISTNDGSSFRAASWLSSSQIATLPANLAAGASTTMMLDVLAPTTTVAQNLSFTCTASDGAQTVPLGGNCILSLAVAPYTYAAAYAGQSDWPTLVPGGTAQIYFKYKNTGNQPWYDDTSVNTASWRNVRPIHLATYNPVNRLSSFYYNWPSVNRPVANFSAVYESDGTTLAANQHVAQPGQIVKFAFTVSPPMNLGAGTYREYFQPIVEGTGGLINYIGTFQDITVLSSIYTDDYAGQSNAPVLQTNQQGAMYFQYKNTGNQPWYDDTSLASAPSGTYPVHLATDNPINRLSQFSATWPGAARPALNFSAVYESDGTTLAANQHVAQPGQIVKFAFTVTVPAGMASGRYREYFQPILEGTGGTLNNPGTFLTITVNP